MSLEKRKVSNYEIREVKKDDKDTVEVEGYIAKFNSKTELFEGYFESIDRAAFDDTLADGHNIFLLYHHDWAKPLASTKTSQLELCTDNIGLRFKATININVSYGRDVVELVRNGLIQGCSFGFSCLEEDLNYDYENDIFTRVVKKVELYEGSILCNPAYEDTEVFTREKGLISEERKKSLELKELKLDYELYKLI
ncbi:HK97 family phage prohead protease [Fusobacterium sp. IOR10]|uniref:HK97 family phage prohead protease n=1 Tax=Fusobacterium sp. IOR10 TaxID=2665157 RepID=UPI0013D3159E|nr:HK97 family phage prohead protease [Fusobacterium sp. IOR10]